MIAEFLVSQMIHNERAMNEESFSDFNECRNNYFRRFDMRLAASSSDFVSSRVLWSFVLLFSIVAIFGTTFSLCWPFYVSDRASLTCSRQSPVEEESSRRQSPPFYFDDFPILSMASYPAYRFLGCRMYCHILKSSVKALAHVAVYNNWQGVCLN
uniref:Uncharacterized protein n=1 Tax=Glossina austeni TaxID=7395 RepID=A0A1A9VFV1_GLOAU